MGTLLLRFQQLTNGLRSLKVAVPILEDYSREGRPKCATTKEIIKQVHDMLLDDWRIKQREIADHYRQFDGTWG
jgi:hypothetical protein